MTLSDDGFCPNCGVPRQGWAKFCGSCGKAYDAPVVAATPVVTQPSADGVGFAAAASPSASAPVEKGGGPLRVILVLIVLGALGGLGYTALQNKSVLPPLGGGLNVANVPPPGTIWFGTSFDPTTFDIRGRSSTFAAHSGFSAVAHLNRSMEGSQLSIRESWNGSVIASSAVSWQGSGAVWGFSPGPLIEPGVWQFDLTDVGGNVLATGSVTAQ